MASATPSYCTTCMAMDFGHGAGARPVDRNQPAPEGMVRWQGRLHKATCSQLPKRMRAKENG